MDPRKLDTGQVLAAGILDKRMPKTGIPEDRDQLAVDVEYPPGPEWIGSGTMDRKKVTDAVEKGAVVHCSEYYGIPYLWKAEDSRYHGRLLQYHAVSESPEFDSADEAVEWFCNTAEAVAG